jgi:hypothetical protein
VRVRATAIGWRAHAALDATGGRARVVAALTDSCYADAGGELIWLGPGDRAVHARAIMAGAPIAVAAHDVIDVVTEGLIAWRPADVAVLRGPLHATGLLAMRGSLGAPRGLGRLLFPAADGPSALDDAVVTRARPHASRLAIACAADDAAAAIDPALTLLGLGDGLTPNGDDYVGGALFALRACGRATPAWTAAGARIVTEARTRTHPISARLLGDLAQGEGWASLHELVDAMTKGEGERAAMAARSLVTLGASSGWDIFAGLVAAMLGRLPDPVTACSGPYHEP